MRCQRTIRESGGEEGFAIELFDHLAKLMRLKYKSLEVVELGDLERRFKIGDLDLVVTALLPTFRRGTFMKFSRPIPYLGVPVSGLLSDSLRKRFDEENIRFCAEDLLAPSSGKVVTKLSGARLMLVDGEAGEEFSKAFFSREVSNVLKPTENPKELTPGNLFEHMKSQKADIFISDVGTCRSILDQPGAPAAYHPLEESDNRPDVFPRIKMGRGEIVEFPQLAVYRIVFGLPPEDPTWELMINNGFECLMSEGIRSLLMLYRKYIEQDGNNELFRPFLLSTDDTVQAHTALRFETIPEICELKDQQTAGEREGLVVAIAERVVLKMRSNTKLEESTHE